jgi:hypothetical protein
MFLPPNPLGDALTHVLAGIAPPKPYRGGTPWYTLGHLDNATQRFARTTAPAALDYSDILIFTQVREAPSWLRSWANFSLF